MRGTIADLGTPAPLADLLPSMLREDPFTVEFCAGLDEVLAPVLLSLDSFPAQLDVRTTPDDMIIWLSQWVGLTGTEQELLAEADADRLRQLAETAQSLHVRRGTRLGIERVIAIELGVRCEVAESGAAEWSGEPGRPLPEGDLAGGPPAIVVTVFAEPGESVDLDRLERLLTSNVPVHVRFRIEQR